MTAADIHMCIDVGYPSVFQAENSQEEKKQAAIKIQTMIRMHLTQVAAENERRVFEESKGYIDAPQKLVDLPRASTGKTPVYFPKDLPVVLKYYGSPENKRRFEQMEQAREICDIHHYTHLVVPVARIYRDFMIESRLPIFGDTKMGIGFYLDHLEQMTEAVKELTGFLCQADLPDIAGNTNDPFSILSTVPIGRYDNVIMFLDDHKQGKIGLLDLESFCRRAKIHPQVVLGACQTVMQLFPYHLDAILDAAEKFNPSIKKYGATLEKKRGPILDYFQKAYLDHLAYVKQKEIDLSNPIKFPPLSSDRKVKIQKVVETMMTEKDQHLHSLGENPNETLRVFGEKVFPDILEASIKFITDLLSSNMELRSPISSYSDLLSVRTLTFDGNDHEYERLTRFIQSKLEVLKSIKKCSKMNFVSKIIDSILTEFEKGKEIAYYNPRFGVGEYVVKCIFC